MRCEVSEDGDACGATAAARVTQGRHNAHPGAQHMACEEHAREAARDELRVTTLEDDDVAWESARDRGAAKETP